MSGAEALDGLARLRRARETIQYFQDDNGPPLTLGAAGPDAALGGGLACGALHEIAPQAPIHLGAACGFALAVMARAGQTMRETLWIQTDLARREGGAPYGPGLDLFGFPSRRLIVLRAARATDALLAMEEALKCDALAGVIAEVPEDSASLAVTRRLSLAARHAGGLGLLLRHRASAQPSAVMTRWSVASACGARDRFGGLATPAFKLALVKNRRGPCGRWLLSWDQHDRVFVSAANPLAMAAPAAGRPHRKAFA
jgi:protein ImuA